MRTEHDDSSEAEQAARWQQQLGEVMRQRDPEGYALEQRWRRDILPAFHQADPGEPATRQEGMARQQRLYAFVRSRYPEQAEALIVYFDKRQSKCPYCGERIYWGEEIVEMGTSLGAWKAHAACYDARPVGTDWLPVTPPQRG